MNFSNNVNPTKTEWPTLSKKERQKYNNLDNCNEKGGKKEKKGSTLQNYLCALHNAHNGGVAFFEADLNVLNLRERLAQCLTDLFG